MKKRSRLSPLHIIVHAGAWILLAVLVFDYYAGNLTVNPYQAAQRRTGNIALIFLVLSLACTPINSLFRTPRVLKLRRPLGLYGYMFASIHMLIFIGLDYGFDLELILLDLADKPYILVGTAALILLSLLAITSFDWWKARLGKNWKRLHRLVYLVNLLVVLHFAWAVKGDLLRLQGEIFRPLLALTIITVLLVLRLPVVRRSISGQQKIYRRRSKNTAGSKMPQTDEQKT